MINLELIRGKKILVIGDIILDEYIKGDIHRISPEAPVPVLLEDKRYFRLGGAANVALNIKALGSYPILLGIAGNDHHRDVLSNLLQTEDVESHTIVDERPTTVKQRYIAKGQQILRVDKESCLPLHEPEALLDMIRKHLERVDAVILQDYDKGVFSANTVPEIIQLINRYSKPIYVDPKIKNFYHYKNITLLKPNLNELKAANVPGDSILDKLLYLRDTQNIKVPLVTRADEGITILEDGEAITIPTQPIEVIDVSGAGDSSLSVMVLAHLADISMSDIGKLSNIAGGIVCKKQGVSTVTWLELRKNL